MEWPTDYLLYLYNSLASLVYEDGSFPDGPGYFFYYDREFPAHSRDVFLGPEQKDDYTLTPGRMSARFTWITEMPWEKMDDTTVRLDGKNSYALIRFPKDLTFSSEPLTVRRKEKFSRLSFEEKAASGKIEIQVELFPKP